LYQAATSYTYTESLEGAEIGHDDEKRWLLLIRAALLCEPYRILYTRKMKTTLDIDDELLVKAKALSARERKSLTSLIEEGLRLRLRCAGFAKRSPRVALAIYRGKGGLISGVDPLSNRSLLDAADDDA
jgi:hypothetical protein